MTFTLKERKKIVSKKKNESIPFAFSRSKTHPE